LELVNNKTEVVTPDSTNNPTQNIVVATVTGNSGSYKVCFQTTTNGTVSG